MRILKIAPYENGAHDNQTINGSLSYIPNGWAVDPGNIETPNFPFGDLTAEKIDGVMTVTSWVPREIPVEQEPILKPAEQREQSYNTERLIEWDGNVLTVTEAATLWNYYAAEGNAKAAELTTLIAAAKETIRAKYPDVESEA